MMVLITEAKRSCVWWAGGFAHPQAHKALSLPLLVLRFVICSHRAPLYWPVASCSQSDPNLPCEVFPCTHTHTVLAPPLLLHTPSSRKGGKEEENSREE